MELNCRPVAVNMLAGKDAFDACSQRLNTTWRQTFQTECQCMERAMQNADGGNQQNQNMNRQQTTTGQQSVCDQIASTMDRLMGGGGRGNMMGPQQPQNFNFNNPQFNQQFNGK